MVEPNHKFSLGMPYHYHQLFPPSQASDESSSTTHFSCRSMLAVTRTFLRKARRVFRGPVSWVSSVASHGTNFVATATM